MKNKTKVVTVKSIKIGGEQPVIMAGPCAVESADILDKIAHGVANAGAVILRGGAFKPRTRRSSFQGLGIPALKYLKQAGEKYNLPVVTEVMSIDQVDMVCTYADMLQVGSRNMYNYPLLREVGKTGKPILLKRGFSATIEEWIGAFEYIGNEQVVFCERGVRGFDPSTRNILDLAGALVVRKETNLPIIVDPSHATGRRDLVPPMALAAIAAGVDGLMIETHTDPDSSISDAAQSISIDTLEEIIHIAQSFPL